MKSLAKPLLRELESLLERKPSSEKLWIAWLYWRWVEGTERSILPLIEAIKPSPVSKPGTVPPGRIFGAYYEECQKTEKWDKVVELLRTVWDREFSRILEMQREDPDFSVSVAITNQSNSYTSVKNFKTRYIQSKAAALGDSVGIPLIQAYLNDNKPQDANEIFNAWLNCGGKFADITTTVELAKLKGYNRLATEWETKTAK
jgi:hypothetical protein